MRPTSAVRSRQPVPLRMKIPGGLGSSRWWTKPSSAERAKLLVLDSARTANQIAALRRRFGDGVVHVHLNAAPGRLESRYAARDAEHKEFASYAEAKSHGTEAQVDALAAVADAVLETDHSSAATLAVTAMSMAGIAQDAPQRLVDVIIGAQYGSEGKGNVCAHIARRYGALMRIGGPNAGHRVFDPAYKYIQLPSGTGSNPNALVLIGAGSTLWLPTLLQEILDHGPRSRTARY